MKEKTCHVGVRVKESLRASLEREAAIKGVSLSSFVRSLMEGSVPDKDTRRAILWRVEDAENHLDRQGVPAFQALEKEMEGFRAGDTFFVLVNGKR